MQEPISLIYEACDSPQFPSISEAVRSSQPKSSIFTFLGLGCLEILARGRFDQTYSSSVLELFSRKVQEFHRLSDSTESSENFEAVNTLISLISNQEYSREQVTDWLHSHYMRQTDEQVPTRLTAVMQTIICSLITSKTIQTDIESFAELKKQTVQSVLNQFALNFKVAVKVFSGNDAKNYSGNAAAALPAIYLLELNAGEFRLLRDKRLVDFDMGREDFNDIWTEPFIIGSSSPENKVDPKASSLDNASYDLPSVEGYMNQSKEKMNDNPKPAEDPGTSGLLAKLSQMRISEGPPNLESKPVANLNAFPVPIIQANSSAPDIRTSLKPLQIGGQNPGPIPKPNIPVPSPPINIPGLTQMVPAREAPRIPAPGQPSRPEQNNFFSSFPSASNPLNPPNPPNPAGTKPSESNMQVPPAFSPVIDSQSLAQAPGQIPRPSVPTFNPPQPGLFQSPQLVANFSSIKELNASVVKEKDSSAQEEREKPSSQGLPLGMHLGGKQGENFKPPTEFLGMKAGQVLPSLPGIKDVLKIPQLGQVQNLPHPPNVSSLGLSQIIPNPSKPDFPPSKQLASGNVQKLGFPSAIPINPNVIDPRTLDPPDLSSALNLQFPPNFPKPSPSSQHLNLPNLVNMPNFPLNPVKIEGVNNPPKPQEVQNKANPPVSPDPEKAYSTQSRPDFPDPMNNPEQSGNQAELKFPKTVSPVNFPVNPLRNDNQKKESQEIPIPAKPPTIKSSRRF